MCKTYTTIDIYIYLAKVILYTYQVKDRRKIKSQGIYATNTHTHTHKKLTLHITPKN